MSQAEIPRPSIRSRLVGISGILLAHALALFFVMVALVKIVPTYAMFFERQDVALPIATQRIVMWSEIWVAYGFLLIFLVMAIDAAVVLSLALATTRKRWILSAYSHVGLLAACAVLVYIGAWLSHPVYNSVR